MLTNTGLSDSSIKQSQWRLRHATQRAFLKENTGLKDRLTGVLEFPVFKNVREGGIEELYSVRV